MLHEQCFRSFKWDFTTFSATMGAHYAYNDHFADMD